MIQPDIQQRAAAVRQRVTLSTIIGRDVTLVKAGREFDGLCPFHDDRSLGSFKVNDGKGLYKCFACGASGDVIDFVMKRAGRSFIEVLRDLESDAGIDFKDAKQAAQFDREKERRARAAMAEDERKRASAKGLWLHAAPGAGSPAQFYLEGRGIDFAGLGRFPRAIRYRHDCYNAELARKMPAMLAAIILNGVHVATHRTWLDYVRGRWMKAPLQQSKKVLGRYAGGHIPLWKGDDPRPLHAVEDGTSIDVSEGIEDGLTIAMALPERRVVAGISVDNIGALVLPPQAGDLYLICQHDAPGSAADLRLSAAIEKHQAQGRRVLCRWPDPAYKDFNDQLMGKPMAAAEKAN
jgi:hypothetical protein